MGVSPAYAAGLFDGEGTVRIRRLIQTRGTGRPGYVVTVTIGMTDREPLQRLQRAYGGSLGQYELRHRDRHKPVHLWTLYGEAAVGFLSDIDRWLIIKRDRARLARRFQRRMGRQVGRRGMSAAEVTTRDAMCAEMKRMNKRGIA